jgi:hypothetical protein
VSMEGFRRTEPPATWGTLQVLSGLESAPPRTDPCP